MRAFQFDPEVTDARWQYEWPYPHLAQPERSITAERGLPDAKMTPPHFFRAQNLYGENLG
jgi:hypothetical protein